MKADLSGKTALVTGAAGGIGRAISRLLADNGAAIVVADIDGAGALEAAADLPRAIAVEMDIRDEGAIDRGVAACIDAFGAIDILVNNAGVNTLAHRVEIDQFPFDEWRRIVGIDLDGTYLVSRAVAPGMIRQGAGRIVNIASTVGLAAMRLQSPFVAAKAGIIHLTRSMALELAPKGILVNAVAPGSTLTAVTRNVVLWRGRIVPQPHRRIHEACAARTSRQSRRRSPRAFSSSPHRPTASSTAIASRSMAAGPPAT